MITHYVIFAEMGTDWARGLLNKVIEFDNMLYH